MVFCVREIEALRLLGWCQYIRPAQLLRVVSETELSNLLTMKLIKYHSKSEALVLTAEGRRLLAGTIWLPDTPRTYHADAVVRRLRLASLLLTAYQSGINVYATQPDELAEGNALFLTSAGRGRGRNPWGSTRTAALLHVGNLLCAAHYVCPDIGCLCPMDELSAFQNNTAKLPGTRGFLFCGESYSDTGKRESQLCGISLYFEERGWITKWDGAEDSDIEPIKGGLSDSMKRAANQWGIGRVLYSMDTVWVNVEKKGKSFIIKPTERGKLDARYLDTLRSLGLTPAKACGIQSLLIPALRAEEQAPAPAVKPAAQKEPSKPQEDTTVVPFPACEYTVLEAKAAGTTAQLILETPEGKRCYAYAMGNHPELQKGAKLYHVEKRMVKKDNVVFFLLDSFEVIQQKDAA